MTQVIAKCGSALRTFAGDVAQGFFEIAHNGFAVVGLVLAFLSITMVAKPELRQQSETALMGWLQARQPVAEVADVIEALLDTYRLQRSNTAKGFETFITTLRRVGVEPFKLAANAVRTSTGKTEQAV